MRHVSTFRQEHKGTCWPVWPNRRANQHDPSTGMSKANSNVAHNRGYHSAYSIIITFMGILATLKMTHTVRSIYHWMSLPEHCRQPVLGLASPLLKCKATLVAGQFQAWCHHYWNVKHRFSIFTNTNSDKSKRQQWLLVPAKSQCT